jgi:S1-C subfamily serine protease/antitoxin component YwqK of YwqJK toxin-antitoxin module
MTASYPAPRFLLLFVFFFLIQSSFGQFSYDTLWVPIGNKGRYAEMFGYQIDKTNATWTGGYVKGLAHGKGTLNRYWNDKTFSTYTGAFKNGLMDGYGTYQIVGYGTFKGPFVNGMLLGKGTYESEDHILYEGDFHCFKMYGEAKKTYPNGTIEEGFFQNGYLIYGKRKNIHGKVTYLAGGEETDQPVSTKTEFNQPIGKPVVEYFNDEWQICQPDSASFYRRITYKAPFVPDGKVRDYFITGELQHEFQALYINPSLSITFYHGPYQLFHQSGKMSRSAMYYGNEEYNLVKTYHENGKLSSIANYKNGEKDGLYKSWSENGILNYFQIYEDDEVMSGRTYYLDAKDQQVWGYIAEDFDKTGEEWTQNENGYLVSVTDSSNLYFENKDSNLNCINKLLPTEEGIDFTARLTIKQVSGSTNTTYGFSFAYKDEKNQGRFLISNDGRYAILYYIRGEEIILQDWTKTRHVLKDTFNTLTIKNVDDVLTFEINDQKVRTFPALNMNDTRFGFAGQGHASFLIDRISYVEKFDEATSKKMIAYVNEDEQDADDSDADEWNGSGSGFFIDKRGFIATNYHVIEDAKAIQVEFFHNGIKKVYRAETVRVDEDNDLAIIKITDPSFVQTNDIPYFFSYDLKEQGTEVFCLGYPLSDLIGENIKFTDGKISALAGGDGQINKYQITVPIQPGNSGGPLFDKKGNLVGITCSRLNKKYNAENVNFAIKTSYLKQLIDVLPDNIELPKNRSIYSKKLTDKIKILSDFIPIIKVK